MLLTPPPSAQNGLLMSGFVPIFESQMHKSESNATSFWGKEAHSMLFTCSSVFQTTLEPNAFTLPLPACG